MCQYVYNKFFWFLEESEKFMPCQNLFLCDTSIISITIYINISQVFENYSHVYNQHVSTIYIYIYIGNMLDYQMSD